MGEIDSNTVKSNTLKRILIISVANLIGMSFTGTYLGLLYHFSLLGLEEKKVKKSKKSQDEEPVENSILTEEIS